MPRVIEVTLSSEKTHAVIEQLRGLAGVVGLALQRDASLDPEGDILTIQATNEGTRNVLGLLADSNVTDGDSILTSEPRSLIAPRHQNGIERESTKPSGMRWRSCSAGRRMFLRIIYC